MEIFKLFGRILVDNTGAVDNIKDTEKKAEEAAQAFDEMAGQAGLMAAAVVAAAAAIVTAIGVKAVTAADELQKSMSKLQAQTGASDEEMKKFKDSAVALYEAGAGQSVDDIAQAMSELSRTAGLSGAELEKTTKNALNLRDTFDMGINESARTANSLMKNFGVSADQAYTLIAQGAQQGANKNGDLLDTLNEYSVQFSAMGLSAEEFTGVLIDGAKNGAFSIDKVGDAVKEFTIRSKDGSKASMNAFQQLGFNADRMTKAFANGGEGARVAFDQVADALAGIEDPVKKNAIGVALFGTQFEDLEAGAIEALGNIQSQTDKNADTLKKIDNTKTSTFGEQLTLLGRQLETNFFIPLGEKIMPKLNELIQWIENNSGEIEKKLGGAVDTLAGFFSGLLDVIKFLIDNFKIFGPILIGVTAAIIAQQILGTIVPLYQAWRAATMGMTIAQIAMNAVMAVNPFTWIAIAIGAVIAAVIAIIFYWDEIVAAAKATWNWLMSFFKSKIGMIVAIMGGPITMALAIIANWELIKEKAVAIWEMIKKTAATVWGAIMNFFRGTFGKIIAIFMGPIGIGLMIIANWETIKAKASAIWDAIVHKVKLFVFRFRLFFHILRLALAKIMSKIREKIQEVVDRIRDRFNIFKERLQIVKDAFIVFKNKIVEIFENVRSKISEKIEVIKGFFLSMKDTIKDVFSSLWGIIKKPLNLVIGGINLFIKGAESLMNKLVTSINSIPDLKLPEALGGYEVGLPDMKKFSFGTIPLLAEGGIIQRAGSVIVGEEGPELLNLPRAAQVTPLDKTGKTIVININDAKVFNERDGERLGELIVKSLKLKGIVPRGV